MLAAELHVAPDTRQLEFDFEPKESKSITEETLIPPEPIDWERERREWGVALLVGLALCVFLGGMMLLATT